MADAVSAIRLTTAAALAAGPVLFETLDGRPFGIRPVLPIAATQPPGEPSRLDAFRAPIAVEVLGALGVADGDPELAEALDRWELSLFQNEPFRSEQLRAALGALLGETWPLRCSVLLGRGGGAGGAVRAPGGARGRGGRRSRRRSTPRGGRSSRRSGRGDRGELVHDLDRELLGLRPRSAAPRPSPSDTKLGSKPCPIRERSRGYRRGMEEARAVLERLERIEALDRAGAEPGELLAELRALLAEAEAWSRSGRR